MRLGCREKTESALVTYVKLESGHGAGLERSNPLRSDLLALQKPAERKRSGVIYLLTGTMTFLSPGERATEM